MNPRCLQTHKEKKIKKIVVHEKLKTEMTASVYIIKHSFLTSCTFVHETEKHYRAQGVKVQTLQKMGGQ